VRGVDDVAEGRVGRQLAGDGVEHGASLFDGEVATEAVLKPGRDVTLHGAGYCSMERRAQGVARR
jgi:hypothetical protein